MLSGAPCVVIRVSADVPMSSMHSGDVFVSVALSGFFWMSVLVAVVENNGDLPSLSLTDKSFFRSAYQSVFSLVLVDTVGLFGGTLVGCVLAEVPSILDSPFNSAVGDSSV